MKYTVGVTLLLLLVLFLSLLNLPVGGLRSESPRGSAQNDIVHIVNAVRNYHVDYGRYPKITGDGFCETTESNARLIRILTAEDTEANPRRNRYLEPPRARLKRGKFVSAVDPETGAWVDPWGNFYRIRMATDTDHAPNPYPDDEPPRFSTDVIAWSLGKDGIQGRKNHPKTKKGSDDVASWE